jgi:mRNA-degrading endonuclease RelE of RelBE toxin-antitoxin system
VRPQRDPAISLNSEQFKICHPDHFNPSTVALCNFSRELEERYEYRLRIGRYRVLFMLEADLISVYSVRDRKQAYE